MKVFCLVLIGKAKATFFKTIVRDFCLLDQLETCRLMDLILMKTDMI